jgi:hypothetical protein
MSREDEQNLNAMGFIRQAVEALQRVEDGPDTHGDHQEAQSAIGELNATLETLQSTAGSEAASSVQQLTLMLAPLENEFIRKACQDLRQACAALGIRG